MSSALRVVSFGLGPIGLAAARLALQKTSIQLVGAIDVDPAKVGGRTVIKAGVKAGEQVVAEGAYALKARLLKSQIGEGH